ncbi:sigma-70 family RNA polymerase sigma factor [Algisphaera agarilytica]|uniref:RNA polymerase sigma factor n=1 Tax=Algisphaera agarilytica TaxID=1385975 RepID=A0A7X0H9Q9_9BACT|nr:FliA/WhiG family RNA polymerase sigma factor [Algisphaera agarilytica]MBB6430761.1 RNA polymerase sigma factor for flagellar operon FliA [Algisphaera agarilytica]
MTAVKARATKPKVKSKTSPKSKAKSATKTKPRAKAAVKEEEAVEAVPAKVSAAPVPEEHTKDEIEQAWENYHKDKSEASRDVLLEAHLPLIQRVVERISRRLPAEVDPGDLMQEGVFGLMHAIDRFDPERGVRFTTFATQSINSAVLDYLRSIDWAPRLARSRSRKLNTAKQTLTKELGREPDEEELFKQMDMSRKEFLLTVRDGSLTSTVSLAAGADAPDAEGGYTGLGQVLSDNTAACPVTESHRRNLKDLVTGKLSRAERLIVVLYYYEQMSMKEIGVTLDLSESRVSQMHSSIMARLKVQLADRMDDFHSPNE